MDDKASEDYISNRLSLYYLISHIIVLSSAFFVGYILDKVMVWKILFAFQILLTISVAVFTIAIPLGDGIYSASGDK